MAVTPQRIILMTTDHPQPSAKEIVEIIDRQIGVWDKAHSIMALYAPVIEGMRKEIEIAYERGRRDGWRSCAVFSEAALTKDETK